jgi:hypothetical protein
MRLCIYPGNNLPPVSTPKGGLHGEIHTCCAESVQPATACRPERLRSERPKAACTVKSTRVALNPFSLLPHADRRRINKTNYYLHLHRERLYHYINLK